MAIIPTYSLFNPPMPPIPPKRIDGYYLVSDIEDGEDAIVKCDDYSIAVEVGEYLFKNKVIIYDIYTNVVASILNGIKRIEKSGFVQGYTLGDYSPVFEYKTRAEIIDDLLLEL